MSDYPTCRVRPCWLALALLLLSLFIAVAVEFLVLGNKSRATPSPRLWPDPLPPLTPADAEALFRHRGGTLYDEECLAQHSLFLAGPQRDLLAAAASAAAPRLGIGRLTDDAISGYIIAASDAVSSDDVEAMSRLEWVPPTDVLLSRPGSCKTYPRRTAEAASILFYAVEEASDDLASLCVKHARTVDASGDRRSNLLMTSSSRGLNGTFRELVGRGADPFYESNVTAGPYPNAPWRKQLVAGYAPVVPDGAASWLDLAASVRYPPRAYLERWVERQCGEESANFIANANPNDGRALDVGLRLVREGVVDVGNGTEREKTLARLYGCKEHDLLFASADAAGHPGLFEPWPGWMRPLDAALAGGCAKSLDLLSTLDGGGNVAGDLLEPCPVSAVPNNATHGEFSPCRAKIGFRQVNLHSKDGFYCDTGPESPPVEALDLLLLREMISQRREFYEDEEREYIDDISIRVFDALDKAKRPYMTRRLAPPDVLAIAACGLFLPSATLRIIEVGALYMFGSLSKGWSEETLLNDTAAALDTPEVTPSLVLQCLLQRHPPSAARDKSERILRDTHGASLLRPDLLPIDPHNPGLFDALRTNMTAAESILESFPELLQQKHLNDTVYGPDANVFHAFFNNDPYRDRVESWCTPLSSNDSQHETIPPAERVWGLLNPMEHKDLLSASIAETKPTRSYSPPKRCELGVFCYDRQPEEQCRFLSLKMPGGEFGWTDVVLETMSLHLHKTMRSWKQTMEKTPVTKTYSLSYERVTTNSLTPLSFAFARYDGLQMYTRDQKTPKNCDAVANMIRAIAREGVGLCEGGGAYFDWVLLGAVLKGTRDPSLVQDVIMSNPIAFCGGKLVDAERDDYQRFSPSNLVADWLKTGLFGSKKSIYILLAYLIDIYPTLCNGTVSQPESSVAFASRLAALSFRPSKRSYCKDCATQVEYNNPVHRSIFDSTFDRLGESEKGEALATICIDETNPSNYKTTRRSFATRSILEGFARRSIAEAVVNARTAVLDNPVAICSEDVAPFWAAVQRDLSNSRTRQNSFGIEPLQMSSKPDKKVGFQWGGEGALANEIMKRSGDLPLNPTLLASWASCRGFVDVLQTINETAWTIDVVKDGVRERNLEWIAAVPQPAKKWLVDREVVCLTTMFPILRASKIYDTTGSDLTAIPDKHWVRVRELLDAVADAVGPEYDLIEWLAAVARARDFFPVVDISNRTNCFDDIRKREIRLAAETLSKHLMRGNRTGDQLDELLLLAATGWEDRNSLGSAKESHEDPESILMLNVLLDAGANASAVIESKGPRGKVRTISALEVSLLTETVAMRLLDAGARPQNPSDFLCLALFHGKAKVVERLLETVNVLVPSGLYQGLTPLHCAACSIAPTQYTVIDAVLAKGGDKNAVADFAGRDEEYGDIIRGSNARPIDMYNDKSLCEAVFGGIVWNGKSQTEEIRQRLAPDLDSE